MTLSLPIAERAAKFTCKAFVIVTLVAFVVTLSLKAFIAFSFLWTGVFVARYAFEFFFREARLQNGWYR